MSHRLRTVLIAALCWSVLPGCSWIQAQRAAPAAHSSQADADVVERDLAKPYQRADRQGRDQAP
jgi:hypothetical protein